MSYYDLSSLGQMHFSTPNIDNLLSRGLFFSEAYAGSSESAPSRASLLTGEVINRNDNNILELTACAV